MAIFEVGAKINEFEIKSLFKEGSYSETYIVENAGGEPFLLKLYDMALVPEALKNRGFPLNVMVFNMAIKQHPNIAESVRYSRMEHEGHTYWYMVNKLYNGRLLSELIESGKTFTEDEAEDIFSQILKALKYLHTSKHLLLTDITPGNILITDEGDVKLFGLGHLILCKEENVGNPPIDERDLDLRYHPTETILKLFNAKTDIFAATAVFYTILFGIAPWNPGPSDGNYIKHANTVMAARGNFASRPLDMSGRSLSEKNRKLISWGLCQATSYRCESADLMLDVLES